MDKRVQALEEILLASRLFKYILAGVGLVIAFWLFYHLVVPKVESKYQREISTWQDSTHKLLIANQQSKLEDSLSKLQSDSLVHVADLKDTLIYKFNDRANWTIINLKEKVKTLAADTGQCIKLCDSWKSTAIAYKNVSDTLKLIIKADSSERNDRIEAYRKLEITFSSVSASNDILSKRLANIPIYKEEKFLGFIPLPTRKTALVTGVITGIVTTSVLFIVTKH